MYRGVTGSVALSKGDSTWLRKSLKPDSLLGIHPSHSTSHLDCANPHRAHRADRTATRYATLFCHEQPTTAHMHPVPSSIHASAAIVKLSKSNFFILPLAFADDRPCACSGYLLTRFRPQEPPSTVL